MRSSLHGEFDTAVGSYAYACGSAVIWVITGGKRKGAFLLGSELCEATALCPGLVQRSLT